MDEFLQEFGERIAQELRNQLISANKDASGNLINSIEPIVVETSTGFEVQISALDYLEYVSNGRLAGTMPPISALLDWVRIRNIPESAVWAIATSIEQNGIEPTNVIPLTMEQITSQRSISELGGGVANFLQGEFIRQFNQSQN